MIKNCCCINNHGWNRNNLSYVFHKRVFSIENELSLAKKMSYLLAIKKSQRTYTPLYGNQYCWTKNSITILLEWVVYTKQLKGWLVVSVVDIFVLLLNLAKANRFLLLGWLKLIGALLLLKKIKLFDIHKD